jgi:hypothetical protein
MTSKTRVEKLEKHFATPEGFLELTGAIYLVTLHVKQRQGKELTDLEKTTAERLESLPPSPQLVEICEDFRPEKGPVRSAGDRDGHPMIVQIVHYSSESQRGDDWDAGRSAIER